MGLSKLFESEIYNAVLHNLIPQSVDETKNELITAIHCTIVNTRVPDAPLRICRDCNRTALRGTSYCAAHQNDNRALREERQRNVARRDSGLKRLYDSAAWRKRTVPFILSRDVLCALGVICGGRAISTDVDHIVRAELYIEAHGSDGSYFFDPDNLRGLCHACHSHKTALENQGLWKEPVAVDPDRADSQRG